MKNVRFHTFFLHCHSNIPSLFYFGSPSPNNTYKQNHNKLHEEEEVEEEGGYYPDISS